VWFLRNGYFTHPILSKTCTRFVLFYEKFRLVIILGILAFCEFAITRLSYGDCIDSEKLAKCRVVKDNSARLACFDNLVTEVLGKEGTTTGAKAQKTYSRDEFERLVRGKNIDEVIRLIGRPEKTERLGDTELWLYRSITYDSVTGKRDAYVRLHVHVKDRFVIEILFN
jgi:hypothetical protein